MIDYVILKQLHPCTVNGRSGYSDKPDYIGTAEILIRMVEHEVQDPDERGIGKQIHKLGHAITQRYEYLFLMRSVSSVGLISMAYILILPIDLVDFIMPVSMSKGTRVWTVLLETFAHRAISDLSWSNARLVYIHDSILNSGDSSYT